MISEFSNIFFPLCSFVISVFLCILFFSKKNIKNEETKIYSKLIICGAIESFTYFSICFIGDFIYNDNLFNIFAFFNKFLICIYIIWMSYLLYYILIITGKNKISIQKKVPLILSTMVVIFITIIFILDIKIYFDPTKYLSNSFGPALNFLYIVCSIYLFIMVALTFKNRKKHHLIGKFIPIYSLFILITISLAIRIIDPYFNITSNIFSLVLLIMYFTIENPDVKMIAQLNEAKAQAEKANNAKSEFLSSMSHEIRTPLNAIVGFSQALSEEDLSDEAKEEVRDIISASNTLLEIVNGILDISKIEANKLEIINKEYNFKDIFDELVALTKGRLGEKPLDFKYIYDESIPSVLYGDSVRVKQIILNLLTNSVKYTKEGSITFTINSVKKDDVIRLIVSVEDTGIGIKEENIGKLFTKFERFDEKNTTIEGTGLGLAITKQLVELMNGKIVVQSIHGKGSKFTVALDQKIVHGKVIESKDNTEDVVEFDLTGKKVLIVDDNNLNLKVASRLIKNYKCDITTVTSGIECLDKINNKEVFDLILMDDMMPRMSGGETLIRLKKIEGFNIPVVALTANAVTGMKEKYLQQGFDDYLAKPIEKGELNRVLHKFLKED